MKTIITAAVLALSSSVAVAHDYEDAFKSPDVSPRYGQGASLSFAPVSPSTAAISLDRFNRGNPDYHSHAWGLGSSPQLTESGEICVTSLDQFNFGNRDSEFGDRKPWERCV